MIRIRQSMARVAIALTLAGTAPTVAAAQHSGHHGAGKNLVEVAVGAGSFTTLVAAVQAAGLAETLMGEGPFTVFAPTDAAFAKLPAGTVEKLLADKDALRKILTYHVVAGRVAAGDVVRANGATPRSVQGGSLDVQVKDGRVTVNGARVVSADVQASNGVIHVIDTVLLPAAAPAGK
ncbi:MAG TPA: fasciclin domain-containing protein [Gemmatimonadaceae bacterium]|nr:fasciclin domain-containing protein [Gemmatimonadaceae bacterium]